MTTYVLVPGFWLGGWAWDEVAARLRADGHEVHAVSPSLAAGTTVEDHIEHVTTLLGGLDEVVLAGHSYGGLVATAAADRMFSAPRELAGLLLSAGCVI
ncbi:alpha/beta fold hydrolase [Actinoplanes sp. G11-F43]|uniref:alpha/beta fold hydrolase n=1 Tax=Actinoplanes sp. G11-F43 TaxID=3424130 RepID=UPI003D351A60